MISGDREHIDRYLRGELSGQARSDFESQLKSDAVLRRETDALLMLMPEIHDAGRAMLKAKLKMIALALPKNFSDYTPSKNGKGPLPALKNTGKLWIWIAISTVAIAVAAFAVWWFGFRHANEHEGNRDSETGSPLVNGEDAAKQAALVTVSEGPCIDTSPATHEILPPADSGRVRHILISYTGAGRTKAQSKKLADSLACAIRNGALMESLVIRFTDDPGSRPMPDAEDERMRRGNYGDYGWIKNNGQMVQEFADFALTRQVGDVDVVETVYGYHIMQCLEREEGKGSSKKRKDNAFFLPDSFVKKEFGKAAKAPRPPKDTGTVAIEYSSDSYLVSGTAEDPGLSFHRSPPVIIKDNNPSYRFHYALADTLYLYGPFKKELLFWKSRAPGLVLHCNGKNYDLKPTKTIAPLKSVEMTASAKK